jgi:protein O-GlcNAc transferase
VGETYVSRMAGSLLHAAGLPELITENFADYEAMALRLATEPGLLAGLRQRLTQRRDSLPLFDMPRFAAGLEATFAHMRDRWAAGLPAAGFAIGDVAL